MGWRVWIGLALVLVTTAPAAMAQSGGTRLVFEIDREDVRAADLRVLGQTVAAKLRETDRVPVESRSVKDGAVVIKLANDGDAAALQATKRLAEIAGLSASYDMEIDGDTVELRLRDKALDARVADVLLATVELERRRLANFGVADGKVQAEGAGRFSVRLPHMNAIHADEVVSLLRKPGVLSFNLVDRTTLVADYELHVPRNGRVALPSVDDEPQVVFADPIITGSDIATAHQILNQFGKPGISFTFNSAGAKRFADATSHNVGNFFAIVVDGEIVSAPLIESPLLAGDGQITGVFTVEEARQLATVLRAGALPAKIKLIERAAER